MKNEIKWEYIGDSTHRLKVPGGWLIQINAGGLCFYPDEKHAWKVNES